MLGFYILPCFEWWYNIKHVLSPRKGSDTSYLFCFTLRWIVGRVFKVAEEERQRLRWRRRKGTKSEKRKEPYRLRLWYFVLMTGFILCFHTLAAMWKLRIGNLINYLRCMLTFHLHQASGTTLRISHSIHLISSSDMSVGSKGNNA